MTESRNKWYLNPWVVLALTFFVLGPFGLPLVYKCPRFGRLMKIVLTIVVAVYTVYAVLITAKTGEQTYKRIMELQATLLGGGF
ncbi:MAG TPA: hypothetical protein PKL97_06175 [Candidatus Omnitrophota bacterium]|nr:hypothetical protein [Candidatus Omnitrophota bacterium]